VLAAPAQEYPDFPAALAFVPVLSPRDALRHLELRVAAIEAQLA
jgi:hypothetical protein